MRLDVLLSSTERYVTITATRVSADLAVHQLVGPDDKPVPGSDWTITHIASGLRFLMFESKAEAVACGKALAPLDWSGKDVRVISRRLRPAVAAIVGRLGVGMPPTPDRSYLDRLERVRRKLQKERDS